MKTIYCKPETRWLELTDGYSLMDDVNSMPINDNDDDEETGDHDDLLTKPSYSVWDED